MGTQVWRYRQVLKSAFVEQKCSETFIVVSLLFRYFLPVEAVAAATSVFTEYLFCESVDSAHNSQISSTFQEAGCLLKLQ